jgi:uncharacterized membrane protein YfcA
MTFELLTALTIAIVVVAFLYSCVGHAGASGYIAAMSLFGLAPAVIKPTALILNILVACISAWQFWRAGYFSWRLFWPFALLAIPMAFLGGYVDLPTRVFKVIVGIVLLFTAIRFLFGSTSDSTLKKPPRSVAVLIGGGLGLLSGLTGTGGGIFLTPLLLFKRWASAKPAAAVSAFFILVNSVSGLLGNFSSTQLFPSYAFVLAIGAMLGGTAGSYFGSQRFDHVVIKRLLAVVLLIAGCKLIFT